MKTISKLLLSYINLALDVNGSPVVLILNVLGTRVSNKAPRFYH